MNQSLEIFEVPRMGIEEWQPLVPFGFAPGEYFFICGGCQKRWNGVDKRARRCHVCATEAKNSYVEKIATFDFFKEVEAACKIVGNTKADQLAIMSAVSEETGELATEIRIAAGMKPGPAGKDGVVGEAIDVILAALDIIHSELGSLDQQEIAKRAIPKLTKWVMKYRK